MNTLIHFLTYNKKKEQEKKQIIEQEKKQIIEQCISQFDFIIKNNHTTCELIQFINNNYENYKEILEKYKYCDLLVYLYDNAKFEILDYILKLDWTDELYINHLFVKSVEDNNNELFNILNNNKLLECYGGGDFDVYYYSLEKAILNNNYEISKKILFHLHDCGTTKYFLNLQQEYNKLKNKK
jgi:hypothetical protein